MTKVGFGMMGPDRLIPRPRYHSGRWPPSLATHHLIKFTRTIVRSGAAAC